jgi:hypothetical protein
LFLLLLLAVPGWAQTWGVPKIGATAETTLSGGNLTLAEPSGIAQGDLQITCIAYRDSAAFTVPGDWNLVATQQSSGDVDITNGIASGVMMWTVRGASAPTLTFNRTGGNVALGRIIAYSGGERTTPSDTGTANTLAVEATTFTTGTFSTAVANELIVACTAAGDEPDAASAFDAATDPTTASGATDTTTAPTAGTWIERADSSTATGADTALAIADAIRSSAGATGQIQATSAGGSRGVMIAGAWKIDLTPTIALNTADAFDFGTDTTPTVEATGTDGNTDDVRYNVQIDSVSTFDSGGSVVDDSYSESNQSGTYSLNNTSKGFGQAFTAVGGNLKSAKFYLSKSASPTGNAVAKLYNHAGTYGTSSVPTGAAIATSDNFDVSTLTGSLQLITFTFSGTTPPYLVGSERYVITIEYSGGSATNIVNVGNDTSSPTHGGNAANQDFGTGNWSAQAEDLIFYVYTADPTLSKISGTDAGFVNTVTGGDTDPFNSGEKASFTVQAGDALAGGTWYWRARAKDPNGGNTYSAWATARSFTVSSGTNFPRAAAELSGPGEISSRIYGAVRARAEWAGASESPTRIYGSLRESWELTASSEVGSAIKGLVRSGSESSTAFESPERIYGAVRATADAGLGTQDAAERIYGGLRAGSELAAGLDAGTRAQGWTRLGADSSVPSDASGRIYGGVRGSSEAAMGSESPARIYGALRAGSELAMTSEFAAAVFGLVRAANESAGGSEYPDRLAGYGRSGAEAANAAERGDRFVPYARAGSDSGLGTQEWAVRSFEAVRAGSDSGLETQDAAERIYGALRAAADSGAGYDAGTRSLGWTRAAADSGLGTQDAAERIYGALRAGDENAIAFEFAGRGIGYTRVASDAGEAFEFSIRGFQFFRLADESAAGFDYPARLMEATRAGAESAAGFEIGSRFVPYSRSGDENAIAFEFAGRGIGYTRAGSELGAAAEFSSRLAEYARAAADAGLGSQELGERIAQLNRAAAELGATFEFSSRLAALTRAAAEGGFVFDFATRQTSGGTGRRFRSIIIVDARPLMERSFEFRGFGLVRR